MAIREEAAAQRRAGRTPMAFSGHIERPATETGPGPAGSRGPFQHEAVAMQNLKFRYLICISLLILLSNSVLASFLIFTSKLASL